MEPTFSDTSSFPIKQLTPFVTNNMRRTFGQYTGDEDGPRSATAYLARWKSENGLD